MTDSEIWNVVQINTNYEVSTHGNFRNFKTKRTKMFNIDQLKSTQTRMRVSLQNDKKGKIFYLHRLIAMTFIPNPNKLEEVNHIDGNPYNNRVENLEWMTREDNMKHFHENREKYEGKHTKGVVLCNKSDEILQHYKCIDDCIVSLKLDISYATLHCHLNTTIYSYEKKSDASKHTYGANNYVGVTINKSKKYLASYKASYKNKYLGSFAIELDAAKAYDARVRELNITPCRVNFPNVGELQAIVGQKCIKDKPKTGIYELQEHYLRFEEPVKDHVKVINPDVEWRQIEEIPNYSVSNTGLVKHTKLDRVLTGYNRNGYLQVTLHKGQLQIARLVHRLVASAFIPNDDPLRIYVDHLDTDPRNNHVSNLRWVTPKENMNNDLTKQNISAGHMKKSPKIFQVEIKTGNILRVEDNAIEMANQTNTKSSKIQTIANYYKRAVKYGFEIILPVTNGSQKTHGPWIFLYENESVIRVKIIKEITLIRVKIIKEITPSLSKKIKVVQIDNAGNIVAYYDSLYEASKTLNINYSGINQVYHYHKYDDATRPECYKLKTTHGFIFKDSDI